MSASQGDANFLAWLKRQWRRNLFPTSDVRAGQGDTNFLAWLSETVAP